MQSESFYLAGIVPGIFNHFARMQEKIEEGDALNSAAFSVLHAGMQVAIVDMTASAWEIRNAASLMFAALIMRMLGFRNLQKVTQPSCSSTQP